MNKKINYVKCQSCEWRIKQEGYDPNKELCKKCNNSRTIIDPKDILCNMCGNTMCPIGTMNEQNPHGLYEAKVIGGYDSYHLFDMTQYTFSFCEKCLRQLFIQCKIKPQINDVNIRIINSNFTYSYKNGKPMAWEEDLSSYEYRIWKDNGGFHQAYLNRKCNSEKDCPNDALYTVEINNHFSEECACEEHSKKYLKWNNTFNLIKFIPNVLKAFL